jgi:hypothetical protein
MGDYLKVDRVPDRGEFGGASGWMECVGCRPPARGKVCPARSSYSPSLGVSHLSSPSRVRASGAASAVYLSWLAGVDLLWGMAGCDSEPVDQTISSMGVYTMSVSLS